MSIHRSEYKDYDPDRYADFRQQVRLLGYGYARDQFLRYQRRKIRIRRVLYVLLAVGAVTGLGLLLS